MCCFEFFPEFPYFCEGSVQSESGVHFIPESMVKQLKFMMMLY